MVLHTAQHYLQHNLIGQTLRDRPFDLDDVVGGDGSDTGGDVMASAGRMTGAELIPTGASAAAGAKEAEDTILTAGLLGVTAGHAGATATVLGKKGAGKME
jgi:hypothetical protein